MEASSMHSPAKSKLKQGNHETRTRLARSKKSTNTWSSAKKAHKLFLTQQQQL